MPIIVLHHGYLRISSIERQKQHTDPAFISDWAFIWGMRFSKNDSINTRHLFHTRRLIKEIRYFYSLIIFHSFTSIKVSLIFHIFASIIVFFHSFKRICCIWFFVNVDTQFTYRLREITRKYNNFKKWNTIPKGNECWDLLYIIYWFFCNLMFSWLSFYYTSIAC